MIKLLMQTLLIQIIKISIKTNYIISKNGVVLSRKMKTIQILILWAHYFLIRREKLSGTYFI